MSRPGGNSRRLAGSESSDSASGLPFLRPFHGPTAADEAKAKPKEEPRGLQCRDCGCQHFYTLETRKQAGGRIMRRRECRYCGRRVTTYEKAFG